MSESTTSKIKMVNGTKEQLAKQLSEVIELDQLESAYGGTNEAKPQEIYENGSTSETKQEEPTTAATAVMSEENPEALD
jgi:hypothetical protein